MRANNSEILLKHRRTNCFMFKFQGGKYFNDQCFLLHVKFVSFINNESLFTSLNLIPYMNILYLILRAATLIRCKFHVAHVLMKKTTLSRELQKGLVFIVKSRKYMNVSFLYLRNKQHILKASKFHLVASHICAHLIKIILIWYPYISGIVARINKLKSYIKHTHVKAR